MAGLRRRNPHEGDFLQAVEEFASSVMPLVLEEDALRDAQILERLTNPTGSSFSASPARAMTRMRVNRAWPARFNHVLGPYKGGLRFPSVNQSLLKFLGNRDQNGVVAWRWLADCLREGTVNAF